MRVVIVFMLAAVAAAGSLKGSASPAGPVDWPAKQRPAPAGGPGEFVPFGKAIPRSPSKTYYTATGVQECGICKGIIAQAAQHGASFYELCGGHVPEFKAMCHAQQKTLQACPEYINNWCYQDLGGSQKLRSPCPDHLKCHYCLGLNPLHCA
jgi:hypothetical protein